MSLLWWESSDGSPSREKPESSVADKALWNVDSSSLQLPLSLAPVIPGPHPVWYSLNPAQVLQTGDDAHAPAIQILACHTPLWLMVGLPSHLWSSNSLNPSTSITLPCFNFPLFLLYNMTSLYCYFHSFTPVSIEHEFHEITAVLFPLLRLQGLGRCVQQSGDWINICEINTWVN